MFTQPDERMAVAMFQRMTGNQSITISAPMRDVGHRVSDPRKLDGQFRDDTARAAYAALLAVEQVGDNVGATFSADEAPDEWQMTLQAHEPLIWAWVSQQIRTRPEYVAKATGIEQIGYLVDLKKPERPATFAEIEEKWETRYTKTGKRKVLNHWREFIRVTGVTCLREITEQVAVDYRDHVYALKLTPKMESNVFTRMIKNGAIVTHRRKEGRCVRACVLWPETVAALQQASWSAPDAVTAQDCLGFFRHCGYPATSIGEPL